MTRGGPPGGAMQAPTVDEYRRARPASALPSPARREVLELALGGQAWGLDLGRVREIVRAGPIVEVPRAPRHFRGVVPVRGAIVPVLDLAARVTGIPCPGGPRARILLVDHADSRIGLLVTEVRQVLRLLPEQIETDPPVGALPGGDATGGIARPDGSRMVILLRFDRIVEP